MKLTTIPRNGRDFFFSFFGGRLHGTSLYHNFYDDYYYEQTGCKEQYYYKGAIENLANLLRFYRQQIVEAPVGTQLYCPFLFNDQDSGGIWLEKKTNGVEACAAYSERYYMMSPSLIYLKKTVVIDPSLAIKEPPTLHFSLEAFLEHFDQLIEDVLRNLDNPPLPAWYGAPPPSATELQIEFYKDRDFGFVLSDVLTIYFLPVWLFRSDDLQHYRLMADNEGLSLVAFFNQWLSQWRKRVQALREGQGLFIPIELADTYIGSIQLHAAEGDALQLSYGFWHNPDQQPYTALEGRPFDEVMKTFSTTKERILQSLTLEVQ
jgi:hypothetical protein